MQKASQTNLYKTKKALKIKLDQPMEADYASHVGSTNIFSFKPYINLGLDSKWMIGLTSLKAYNSTFKVTQEIT